MENPLTILIVDDEIAIQKLLSYGLRDFGYETIVASSGEECLEMMTSLNVSCVLLDVGLPKMNGMETLKRIRHFSKVPLIMITVEDDDESKIKALDCGADDYVTKPFSMAVLRSRIKAVLRRQEPQTNSAPSHSKEFVSDRIKIDFDARKVWANQQEIHLTATEFELLSFFIENRGKVITHQSILAKIWGNKAGDQMHYLRVYINNLRRKIEPTPSIPRLIVTEPGIGYRFEE